ncbi:YopX family protein [Bacillus licheniformis]|nr:SPBc2 prophage-derived uncharacterized protein YopX [Bacillus licheniformis]
MHYWHDEGISLTIKNDGSWFLWHEFGGGCVVSNDDKDAALMWGAGEKDKDGWEIYERDVAKFSFYDEGENIRFMHIVFEGSGFKMKEIYRNYWLEKNNGVLRIKRGIQTDHKGTLQELYKSNEFYSMEVIGDVYRNPELLKVGE